MGIEEDKRLMFINKNLPKEVKWEIISHLKEYKDHFVWIYDEFLGLSKDLVKHRLLIKDGFQPHKQSST